MDENLFLLDLCRVASPHRVDHLDACEAEGLFYGEVHLRSDPATCGGGMCWGGGGFVGRVGAERVGTRDCGWVEERAL